MPPEISRLQRLLLATPTTAFVCPTCRFRALSSIQHESRPWWTIAQPQIPRQRASTIAPVSIVDAVKNIPPAAKELHESLSNLEKDASIYASLSQLQLALRGLESETPITRVAILGINGLHGARRLARVLLADPLATESTWEKQLTGGDQNGRAILLRYGEDVNFDQRHPLLRTLSIPSTILQTHRLEVLLQAITPYTEDIKAENHHYLVPGLELMDSSAARYSMVRYPVHKSLIFGDRLVNLSAYSAITAAQHPESVMLKGAINTRWIDTLEQESNATVVPVNIDRAEAAITTFRQSLDNSVSYEHAWFSSGLPSLSTWFLSGLEASPSTIKPPIQNLISSLLSVTESRILASETEHLQKLAYTAISPSTRTELSNLITAWSERAHTELRDQLSLAFSSPNWRKLAWWKLPMRVDDVGMITSDIIQRSWLTGAEKELIWLVGRIEQAGLLPQPPPPPLSQPNAAADKIEPVQAAGLAAFIAPANTVNHTFAVSDLDIAQPRLFDEDPIEIEKTPYPQSLSLARRALSRITIPPLQSLAQALVLQSLTTTFLTSTLSALLYVSISTTSMYEAGVVAALGAVYSARRLQKRWEEARAVWMESVRDEGGRVLRDGEGVWRGVVEGGDGKGGEDGMGNVGVKERRTAREAVGRVRRALEEVKR